MGITPCTILYTIFCDSVLRSAKWDMHSQVYPGPFRAGLRVSKLHLVANSSRDARIIYRIGCSYAEWRAASSSASWAGPVLTYNKNETAVGKAPARDSGGVPRDEFFISA
jgi:hypothetical protein